MRDHPSVARPARSTVAFPSANAEAPDDDDDEPDDIETEAEIRRAENFEKMQVAAARRRESGEWSQAFDLNDKKSGAPASKRATPADKSHRADRASSIDKGSAVDKGSVAEKGSARDRGPAVERPGKRASNVSMHQLARRGMSRWELEQVLARREIEPETAQAELDRLESVGLLDDAALAVTLVYTQHTRKGLGRSAIAQELKRRHIDPLIIEDALEEIADDDELERATELAVKRVGQLASYDDETAKRRLHGFLARKGYDSSTVRQAMDAALATRGKRGVRFE
ncbi:MAG TPA: regulatory protein RecX [Leifsonia sp.]|nr:regulatory protein RecX [Leifsonia sp.]